jgi:hypothetical protein
MPNNKPATPKHFRAWAVFNGSGTLLSNSLAKFRDSSILRFEHNNRLEWKESRKHGYTCRRVVVTPESNHER